MKTSLINVSLSFISAFCILIKTIKFIFLTNSAICTHIASTTQALYKLISLRYYLSWILIYFRSKVKAINLILFLKKSLHSQIFLFSLSKLDEQIFSSLSSAISSFVDFWLKGEFLYFSSHLFTFGFPQHNFTLLPLFDALLV